MARRFNSPPGWPTPPADWTPPQGWQPDPAWPAPPAGWQFWTDDAADASSGYPDAPSPQAAQPYGQQSYPSPGYGQQTYPPAPPTRSLNSQAIRSMVVGCILFLIGVGATIWSSSHSYGGRSTIFYGAIIVGLVSLGIGLWQALTGRRR